jgi:hypothetical protein
MIQDGLNLDIVDITCINYLEFLLWSHFRNSTEFYRIWIVTLWISSNVTEKLNSMV